MVPTRLKRLVPVAIGLAGVGLGLLYSIVILTSNPIGCSCGWNYIQAYFGISMLIGSIIGLAGSLLSLRNRKIGRLFLIAGACAIAPLAIWLATDFWYTLSVISIENIAAYLIFFPVFYGAMGLPSFLLLVAGLLTIPKFRRIVSALFHRFSEWYYSIPERLAAT